jgi:hypothetical protein
MIVFFCFQQIWSILYIYCNILFVIEVF